MFKSHTILNFERRYDTLLCLLFKNNIIAVKEIKMLELKTIMALFKSIFQKIFKF